MLTTTRFPADAALRYSREADFGTWAERLRVVGPLERSRTFATAPDPRMLTTAPDPQRGMHVLTTAPFPPQVGPLELSDIVLVERFCAAMLLSYPRLHCLVNNAAQTLTRPVGWQVRMAELEARAQRLLPPAAAAVLRAPTCLETCTGGMHAPELCAHPAAALPHPLPPLALPPPPLALPPPALASTTSAHDGAGGPGGATARAHDDACAHDDAGAHDDARALLGASAPLVSTAGLGEVALADSAMQVALADFPAGVLDESRQPLDLSGINSWSRRLGEVRARARVHACTPLEP